MNRTIKEPSLKLIQLIVDELGLKTDAAKGFLLIALENTVLFDQKHQDYGSRNMSSFGAITPIIRANDKFERLKHIYKNHRSVVVNEAVIDSYIDISNLCIIALMMESGQWPDYVPEAPPPKRVRKKRPTPGISSIPPSGLSGIPQKQNPNQPF